MSLHLVRQPIDLTSLAHFAAARRLGDDDLGYALHAALAARFGGAAPRPFRFLPDHRAGAHLLGYTTMPEQLREAAGLPAAEPQIAGIFPADPSMQAMPVTWRAGARYGFEVRARPVVRFGSRIRALREDRPGAWQKHAGEMDAYVAACEQAVAAGGTTDTVDREAVYRDWLATRLAGVATIETAALRQFRRSTARRSTHRPAGSGPRLHRVEGPDAVIGGILVVGDPVAFTALLARGVGRHAAFGYGMLLLSPPGRA